MSQKGLILDLSWGIILYKRSHMSEKMWQKRFNKISAAVQQLSETFFFAIL